MQNAKWYHVTVISFQANSRYSNDYSQSSEWFILELTTPVEILQEIYYKKLHTHRIGACIDR
jgi:hypothetical protein